VLHDQRHRISQPRPGCDGSDDRQILALQALSGLLAACATNPMPFSELPYLLDPIIDRQKALVDALMGIDVAVDAPSRTKHKSKPVLVADNS
jgi:hypothetical protein